MCVACFGTLHQNFTTMSGYNSKKRGAKPRKDIKQPSISVPAGSSYYGQQFPAGGSVIDRLGTQQLGQVGGLFGNSLNLNGELGGSGLQQPFVTNPNNGQNANGQNPMNSTYAQMLNNNAADGFSAFLASLGINQQTGLTGSQRDAWNEYLLQQMLQYYMTQENRDYNRALQLDDRVYNSATNQLARLMGAGISRDAALQLLSGSGGSGGSGVPYSQPASPADMSAANEAGRLPYDIANTVFNGVNCLSGLVSLGFSIPQAVQQTQFLKNQNYLVGSQVSAFKSAGQAFAILNNAGAAADAFGSVSAAGDALSNLAKDGNQDAALFLANGGLQSMKENAPFASQTLGNLYQSERRSSDYNNRFAAEMRKFNADSSLSELSYDSLLVDIDKASAELDQIVTNTQFIEENIALARKHANVLEEQASLLRKQGKNIDADTLLKSAEKLRVDAEKHSVELQNNATDALYQSKIDGHTGLHWITESSLRSLYNNSRILAKTGTEKMFNAQAALLLSDYESLTAVNALMQHRATMSLDFAREHPSEAKFGSALQDLGIDSYFGITNAGREKSINGIDITTPQYRDLLNRLNQ